MSAMPSTQVDNKSGVSSFHLLDFMIGIVRVAHARFAAENASQASGTGHCATTLGFANPQVKRLTSLTCAGVISAAGVQAQHTLQGLLHTVHFPRAAEEAGALRAGDHQCCSRIAAEAWAQVSGAPAALVFADPPIDYLCVFLHPGWLSRPLIAASSSASGHQQ